MQQAIPVDQLEVIGYADVLDQGMLPSIVPPIFRVQGQPERSIVPPFSLNAGFVCGGSEIHSAELEGLRGTGEVVLFNNPFPAKADFELWVDESGQYRYETRILSRANLRRIARESVQRAGTAFGEGRRAEAERYCSSAISADEKSLEAYVIKAAIRVRENDEAGERLMADLVSSYLDRSSFTNLVDTWLSMRPVAAPGLQPKKPPMRDIAILKAAA